MVELISIKGINSAKVISDGNPRNFILFYKIIILQQLFIELKKGKSTTNCPITNLSRTLIALNILLYIINTDKILNIYYSSKLIKGHRCYNY